MVNQHLSFKRLSLDELQARAESAWSEWNRALSEARDAFELSRELRREIDSTHHAQGKDQLFARI